MTISYAWFDSTLVDSISVGDKSIPIPASAGSILRCTRSPTKTITLWIDCVCIDQNNEHEKGHQVGLVVAIFQRSRCTIAHLGEDHDNTAKRAFDGFSAIYEAWLDSHEHDDGVTDLTFDIDPLRYSPWIPETIDWVAIEAIMRKPYFT
jgi:hypothetical protein